MIKQVVINVPHYSFPLFSISFLKDLQTVTNKAQNENIDVIQSSLEYLAVNNVSLSKEQLEEAEELMQQLKDHVDVTRIYSNITNSNQN